MDVNLGLTVVGLVEHANICHTLLNETIALYKTPSATCVCQKLDALKKKKGKM